MGERPEDEYRYCELSELDTPEGRRLIRWSGHGRVLVAKKDGKIACLMGSPHPEPTEEELEIETLRARVAELEGELKQAREVRRRTRPAFVIEEDEG